MFSAVRENATVGDLYDGVSHRWRQVQMLGEDG